MRSTARLAPVEVEEDELVAEVVEVDVLVAAAAQEGK